MSPSLRDRCAWRKAEAPRAWRPTDPDTDLVGWYAGKSVRNGNYGQYEVVLVRLENGAVAYVSGMQIVQLVDGAQIDVGQPIRIWFEGEKSVGNRGNTMKCFKLFVGYDAAEGEVPPGNEPFPHVG